jgi:hypothetical protein
MSLSSVISTPLNGLTIAKVTPYNAYFNSLHINQPGNSGTLDQFLTYNATTGSVNARAGSSVPGNGASSLTTNTSGQSVPSGTITTVLYPFTTILDQNMAYDNSTGTFTSLVAGYLFITFNTVFSTNTTGDRQTWMLVNGNYRLANQTMSAAQTGLSIMNNSIGFNAQFGDSFQIQAYQTSGATITIQAVTPDFSGINIIRISPKSLT